MSLRTRMSLECSAEVKAEIDYHRGELGQWSLIGGIRESTRRSRELLAAQRRGKIYLMPDDGEEPEEIIIE
jgi:hypothetical protein